MVTQRSASLNREQEEGRSSEPCPGSSDPGSLGMQAWDLFCLPAWVTCTHSYLLSCMGVAPCPSGGRGQTVVPVFGWASQGLKGTSAA